MNALLSAMNICRHIFPILIYCLLAAVLGCSLNPETFDPLDIRRADALGDTVSIFPHLRYYFTTRIDNNNVLFNLEPEDAAYYTQLNSAKDTLDFIVTGLLAGNASYTIANAQEITSQQGGSIPAGAASFTFYTHARETEPNDTRETKRAFASPVFGEVYSSRDTDFYFLPEPSGVLYLRSYESGISLGLGINDSVGQDTVVGGSDPMKYLSVPSHFTGPSYVRVYSVLSAGRYELGLQYQ